MIDNLNTDIREKLRPNHKAYLAQFSEDIAFAGPLFSDNGVKPIGSLLAIRFASREEADKFINQEPYAVAGLYSSITIKLFKNLWPQRSGFPE
jgi:uncharacterized protein